ncbi:MAG: HAMP domain-containing histidine kinase [Actinomycetia bacterium]|nr:HAMP domain-containing histidine kinase [bacterium]MCP4960918.1 HAMP domain-containing histidine kinase [Actinomycetes bacterium]
MSRPWTLRRRLTIVVGLIILIVSASIAVAVSLATRNVLIAEVDEALLAFSTRPPPLPNPADPPATIDEPSTEPTGDERFQPFALIRFDHNGDVAFVQPAGYADDPEPLPDVSALTPTELAGSAGTSITLGTVGDAGSLRALVREDPDGYELLAQSLDSVNSTTRQMVVTSLLVSLLAALAGIGVAWLLLRRGFRPVDDMIDTAGAIASGDLSRRTDPVESTTELGQLATALDHMLARIESADRDRLREAERLRRFVDDASHELRTPIAAITGYAELYTEGGVEPGPKLDRAMARINEASHRAGRLIEDLLALARLDREIGFGRERIDLAALVEDIAEDGRVSTGRDIRSDIAGPVIVDADPVWLRQAIENLISNAATHAPTSTSIELVVHHAGNQAEIAVIDHGPGIAETERERVFDRFARPDAGRDRTHGGAGLGLAIVREVVLSHDGGVEISETPGGGATVRVSLPLADQSAPSDAEELLR